MTIESSTAIFRDRTRIEHCAPCEGRRQRFMGLTARTRNRARMTFQQAALKGGNLTLRRLRVPDEAVVPGGEVVVEAEITNTALFISPTDRDACSNAANDCVKDVPIGGLDGYCYDVFIIPETGNPYFDFDNCIEQADVTGEAVVQTVRTSFPAPDQEMNWNVRARIATAGSDQTSADLVDTVQIRDDGVTRGEPPAEDENGNGDGDGGGGGPILPCWADPNRSCATPELIGWTVAGVGLAAVLTGASF